MVGINLRKSTDHFSPSSRYSMVFVQIFVIKASPLKKNKDDYIHKIEAQVIIGNQINED